jgi:hypothetical protein
MTGVTITVPHAAGCGGSFGHPCDYASIDFADRLEDSLKRIGVRDVQTAQATTPRTELDMNRKRARKAKYRRDIISWIRSNKNRTWVVDVHSFPGDSFRTGSDFVILDTRDGNYDTHTPYVRGLTEYARERGLSVSDIPGADSWQKETNDIMDTSRGEGAYSFLIEVKEDLKEKTLDSMAKAISEYIYSMK